jgi:hypothetical protein
MRTVKGVAMMGALHQDRKLDLITGLCRELSKLGLNVGLSDARPAVVVRTSDAPELWITVDDSAEFFEWAEPESRHRVTDTPGAAEIISEYAAALISESVKARRSGPGEGP